MKTKFFVWAVTSVLLLNVFVTANPDTPKAKAIAKKREAARLVAALPASDGIMVFETKRFLNDALPKVLSANQPMLAEILGKINEMENTTGIDLRKFDQVAVGIAIKQLSPTNVDFEPVAIANGDINAGALLAIAKMASNGVYREESIGDKNVYVFTVKDVLQKTTIQTQNSKVAQIIDQALKGLTKEVAVTALDKNTLVIGSIGRLRETIEGKSHVAADISKLLTVSESSVMSFAVKAPGGLSKLIPLDNDELGSNIDSIQYLSGSMDVAAAGTSMQVTARTKALEQAKGLKETLDGLQIVGGAVFGSSKRNDQKIYGRLIKSAKILHRGNDVSIELLVPQADVNILLAGIK